MIDPITSLAFSMYSNKGVYALLLGSGISRSAGIPTGWEIIIDLIRKVAYMNKEDPGPNPEKWYIERYGRAPNYSELLETLAKTSAERSLLLKDYFEPTDEEREQGLKIPTQAHKSIAKLVSNGFVKVIITTNFDRLIEKSLEQEGVNPIVISTTDAIKGAIPLVHTNCTIIKLHGDYLDSRIKNTPSELSNYDKEIDQLLDRIFDEFGLLICGWSGEWDIALRNALMRCSSFRYTIYWTSLGETNEKARELINLRRAELIRIKNADDFFSDLEEKVSAISELSTVHPLSPKIAVERLKKYISEEYNAPKG